MRPLLLALLALTLLAAPASAQTLRTPTSGAVGQAVDALERASVYVHPDAEPTLTNAQVESLEDRISAQRAGPMFIAILPEDAVSSPGQTLQAIAQRLGRRGVYGLVAGSSFYAGQISGGLPRGTPGRLAEEAIGAGNGELDTILAGFVDGIGAARASGGATGVAGGGRENGGGGDGEIGVSGIALLALAGLGGGAFLLARRRRTRESQAEFAEAKENARDDLVALGDEVRALDIDMELDTTPAAAKEHYAHTVALYQRAEEQWERSRSPGELEPVGEALEEGRYEMTAAKAIIEGREAPERRPPCFFDPRHGPSHREVEWAPPGGAPRLVPACEADAQHVERGDDPAMREVMVGGNRMPYWQAGPAYAPFAGGFFSPFGGGLLPGLLVGTMLGSTLGGLGAGAAHGAGGPYGEGGEGDSDGGGDFGGGDFGGGGSDFGGGDFGGGGGDFGGGGGFGGGDF